MVQFYMFAPTLCDSYTSSDQITKADVNSSTDPEGFLRRKLALSFVAGRSQVGDGS